MNKKRWLALALCGVVGLGMLGGCRNTSAPPVQAARGNALRIMSYNVAGFQGNFFKGTGWTARVQRFAAFIHEKMPDSIGTQEMAAKWLKKLDALLPEYASAGVARDDGKEEGEYNSILYLKEKYELVDSGTFWLSKTPDQVSKYDGETGCNRICTWAVLKEKTTGQTYAHVNTHFDNVSAQARAYGAQLVREKAESFSVPVVITGDFNCSTQEEPYQILTGSPFLNTQEAAAESGSGGSYHDWGKIDPPEGLDYCLVRQGEFTVDRYQVLSGTVKNKYISDHNPVYVELTRK